MGNLRAFLDTVESIIVILSAIIAVIQLCLLRKQTKSNHESLRRKTTIDTMTAWCTTIRKDTSFARYAAKNLSEKQCKNLYDGKPFEITSDIKEDFCKFCSNRDSCKASSNAPGSVFPCSLFGDGRTVDGLILSDLRWHVISYLNALETVMTAYHMGIVDKDVIEEQFQFLLHEGNGHSLSAFRAASKGYPYIEEFIDTIKDKPQVNPKKPL